MLQCPHCGRVIPTASAVCAHCGVPVAVHDERLREALFARAFFARRTPLTYAILVFNIVIYLLMAASSPAPLAMLIHGQEPVTLINFGAKTDFLLWYRGEWFRLVTPIFIHIGLLHLASNSYALVVIGPLVERLYGSARFALIYLLSGVGGVLGSFAGFFVPLLLAVNGISFGNGPVGRFGRYFLERGNPMTPGAGASGAIFGLLGLLFVTGFKYRHELPPAFRRTLGAGILPVIAINLFIGLTVPFIDNAAHLGGLIVGALLALVVPYLAPGRERASRAEVVLLLLCLLTVAWSFFRAYQTRGAEAKRGVRQASSAPHAVTRKFTA